MPLTKTQIDRLEYDVNGAGRQVHYDRENVPGFGVRVYPGGKKTFVLQFRLNGTGAPRLYTIGTYGPLTLDAARKKARTAYNDAQDGKDPADAKRRARTGETVKDLAELYLKREAKQHKTASEIERRIRKYIIPKLGAKRVKDVTTADISRLHYHIGDSAPVEANRVRGILHRMFEKARKWGLTEKTHANPVVDVDRFEEKSRERFAGPEELELLWRAIEAEPDLSVRVAFRLILLTGCRRNEVLERRWKDVDLKRRELKLPNPKAGKPQLVALSDEAVDVLRELPRGVGDTPLFNVVTVKRAWSRIRARLWLYANPDDANKLRAQAEKDVQKRKAFSKHASTRAEAIEKRLLALARKQIGDDERLTIHDLRRSVGSSMALHSSPTVVGKALRNPSAVATYTRISDNEARRAIEEHGKRLLGIVSGRN